MMAGIYLGAVRSFIKDAFPGSVVDVWAEGSMFPDKNCVAIKARADNDWAYVTLYPDSRYSEEHIAQLLISLIQEQRGKE